MKRIGFAFLFLGIFSVSSWGQGCPPPSVSNEIGTRLFSLQDGSKMGGASIGARKMHPTFLSGIHYKRYNDVGAFRLSFGYTDYRFEQESGQDCIDCLDIDAKVSGGIAKVGYEIFGFLGPVEPFAAIDVFASYDQYLADVSGTGFTGAYQEYTERRGRTGVGLSPAIGFRLFLSYAISVSAETSINGGLYMNKNTTNNVFPDAESYTFEDNKFDWEFHPVNWLSLNVMF